MDYHVCEAIVIEKIEHSICSVLIMSKSEKNSIKIKRFLKTSVTYINIINVL